MRKKRCHLVKMTNEARVLKELRLKRKLSMMHAGYLISKSDSYISHLENGRMDIPRREKLAPLLSLYEVSFEQFQNLAENYESKTTNKDILIQIINKLDDLKIQRLLVIIESSLKQNHLSYETKEVTT